MTSPEDVWTSYCTFVFVTEWFVGTAYLGRRHYGTPPRMMETSEILLLSGVAASRIEWQFFWSRISCTCPTKQPSRNDHFLIARAKTFQDIILGALRKHGHILLTAVCVEQEYQKKRMQEGGRISLPFFQQRLMAYASITDMSPTQDQGCCQQASILWSDPIRKAFSK